MAIPFASSCLLASHGPNLFSTCKSGPNVAVIGKCSEQIESDCDLRQILCRRWQQLEKTVQIVFVNARRRSLLAHSCCRYLASIAIREPRSIEWVSPLELLACKS